MALKLLEAQTYSREKDLRELINHVKRHETNLRERIDEVKRRETDLALSTNMHKAATMIQKRWRLWKATRSDVVLRKGLHILKHLDAELNELLSDSTKGSQRYMSEVLERQLEMCDAIQSRGNDEIRKQ